MPAKPTPGPWRVGAGTSRGVMIYSDKAHQTPTILAFCVQNATSVQDEEGRANAEFIVRACNSHQALLDALKEMRVALAGAMRVLAESGKTDEFLAVMKSLGVKDSVGVRATAAIALAQNPDCLCIVGCIVNDACPIHGDAAVSQADGEA